MEVMQIKITERDALLLKNVSGLSDEKVLENLE